MDALTAYQIYKAHALQGLCAALGARLSLDPEANPGPRKAIVDLADDLADRAVAGDAARVSK